MCNGRERVCSSGIPIFRSITPDQVLTMQWVFLTFPCAFDVIIRSEKGGSRKEKRETCPAKYYLHRVLGYFTSRGTLRGEDTHSTYTQTNTTPAHVHSGSVPDNTEIVSNGNSLRNCREFHNWTDCILFLASPRLSRTWHVRLRSSVWCLSCCCYFQVKEFCACFSSLSLAHSPHSLSLSFHIMCATHSSVLSLFNEIALFIGTQREEKTRKRQKR